MNDERAIEILGKVIDLLRAEGVQVDSPYDVENFFDDVGSHSQMFATGRFETEE